MAIIQGMTAQCAEHGHKETGKVFPQLKHLVCFGVTWASAGDSSSALCRWPWRKEGGMAVPVPISCCRVGADSSLSCAGGN